MKRNRFLRLIFSLIYVVAFWCVLSKVGFLPQFLTIPFPKKVITGELGDEEIYVQPDVKNNSPFYYTGNTFTKFQMDARKNTIEAGTIERLGFLSNDSLNHFIYYDVGEDRFYFLFSPAVYSYKEGTTRLSISLKEKKIGRVPVYQAKKEYSWKAKAGYDDESFVIPYRDIYFVFGKPRHVSMYTPGPHGVGGYTMPEECDFERIADVLYRNETEAISLVDLMQVMYYANTEQLMGWHDHTAVFFENTEEGDFRFTTVNAENGERSVYTPTAGKGYGSWMFSLLDDRHVFFADRDHHIIYRWDFIEDRLEKVFDYPDTEDGVLTYRVREDGSLLIAGMKKETDHAWVYIEKTGELLEYDEQVRTGMTHAMIGLGTHSAVVVDIYENNRYLCHTWDFTEKLRQGEGTS